MAFSLVRRQVCSSGSQSLRRFFSALQVSTDLGVPKVRIPLTSSTKDFLLGSDKTVGSLIEEIKKEDGKAQKVSISFDGETVISSSTLLTDLLRSPFKLKIDGKEYTVEPCSQFLFRSRDTLPLAQYMKVCQKLGLPAVEARTLSRYLHNVTLILNADDNNKSNFNKEEVLDALQKSLVLHGQYLETETQELKTELTKLQSQYTPMEKLKGEIDRKSLSYANRWTWVGMSGLLGQFAAIYYGTYELYSWDVMEPITYLLGLGNMIGGFAFFTLAKREYAFDTAYGMLVKRKQKKLYAKHKLTPEQIEALETQIADIQSKISRREKEILDLQSTKF